MRKLLTIGILSYNRPLELKRALESILPVSKDVEILICDDCSPKITLIEQTIQPILSKNPNIQLKKNSKNLGFDRNICNVIENSSGQFVMLLSDDDYLEKNAIPPLLEKIQKVRPQVGFLRYISIENFLKVRKRDFEKDRYFASNEIIKGRFIYNSILFSGLIFCKDSYEEKKESFNQFYNSIYIQVAIFLTLGYQHGVNFISGKGIILGGDGENGFGLNQASQQKDTDLSDRTNLKSNLAYHKRLLFVISRLSENLDSGIKEKFLKEYKIRSIKAILSCKEKSKEYATQYANEMMKLDIECSLIYKLIVQLIIKIPKPIVSLMLSSYTKIINTFKIIK